MKTVADGQVASSATAIYTATADGTVNLVLTNTSSSLTETVLVTLLRTGSTARRVARAVLAPNEHLLIQGLGLASGDILKVSATDATTVDYTVGLTTTDLPYDCKTLDASGQIKTAPTAAAVTNLTVGSSTIALGTNSGTAAALPAGTANVYPTTAADGTVGVILTASDQVTGRTVFIGNGVSNQILKVYGPSGAVINGGSANAAFSSASGKGVIAVCLSGSGNTWLMF